MFFFSSPGPGKRQLLFDIQAKGRQRWGTWIGGAIKRAMGLHHRAEQK